MINNLSNTFLIALLKHINNPENFDLLQPQRRTKHKQNTENNNN